MDRERIKLLIELSSTVEEADQVIVDAGFTVVREKYAFLTGMFGYQLVGRYNAPTVTEEDNVEMDYYAVLSAIICCKWEG